MTENIYEWIKKTIIVYRAITKATIPNPQPFRGGEREKKMMMIVMGYLNNKFGGLTEDRIVDYCIAMVHYRKDMKNLYHTQVFSPSVMVRYAEFNYKKKYFENKWLAEHHLTREGLVNLIKDRQVHRFNRYLFMRSEESTKQRSVENWLGPMFCEQTTTLYSPFSPTCQECPFADQCQERTNQLYPEILRVRREAWARATYDN